MILSSSLSSPIAPLMEGSARTALTLESVAKLRLDFPILTQTVHGKPLVYLDNAATAQTPIAVVEAVKQFYLDYCSNIHRGVHRLSEVSTQKYEASRKTVQRFLNAKEGSEIIFVRGATEAINLVAHSFGDRYVGAGDEIVVSQMEHHSNIVPWQQLCERTGAKLLVAPMGEDGALLMDAYEQLLGPRTKLVAITHTSNALGTINPVKQITALAHAVGAKVLLDGAQAVPHCAVDVQDINCDFYVLSGHKLYGPTGIGVLYGRTELLDEMPPFQGGGDMILSVTFEKTIYAKAPAKFEAGTPHISGAIGLAAAIEYINSVGIDAIDHYEQKLLAYATEQLQTLEGLRIVGTAPHKAAVCSFVFDDIHPHDIGTILDRSGVAIRTGHHCAQPVMEYFKIPATARASFSFYNTKSEIDQLVNGLKEVIQILR